MEFIAQTIQERQPAEASARQGLLKAFVPLREVLPSAGDAPKIPECLADLVATREDFAMPAGGGHTLGHYFSSTRRPKGQEEAPLILLGHGLAQSPCESNWVWISAFLEAGYDVLCWALDGHSQAELSRFDPRLASRSLSLILDRLSRSAPELDLYLVTHGLSATYALLLAMRQAKHPGLLGVVAMSPSLEREAPLESQGCFTGLRHPIHLVRSGYKLSKYYGPGGVRKFWKGENTKDLKRRLQTAAPLEAQVKAFLGLLPDATTLLSQCKVPTLIVASKRVSDALEESVREAANPLVSLELEFIQGPRGVQYLVEWPEKVMAYLAGHGSRSVRSEEVVCRAVQ